MKNLLQTAILFFVSCSLLHALPVQWIVEDGGNGHYYEVILVPQGISWESAYLDAISRGVYLATITSAEENSFVHTLAASNPQYWSDNGLTGPWLGGFQLDGSPEPSGGWQWVTGEPFIYTNWTKNEPDNGTRGTENKLHFWDGRTPTQYASTWNDRNSGYQETHPCSYIVEYNIPEPASLMLLGLGGFLIRKDN